ncbi:hypothetical protein GRX03_01480 [Halovenus sp. WSH3]|uniref:CARDB domain-containing protein n=1 Tax=Halovenus carboxidivorans TaxID=2692199 RepID=A0A6B0T4R2_9EURY|nr:hypothetical protein [Halovenus carboxidivorans]
MRNGIVTLSLGSVAVAGCSDAVDEATGGPDLEVTDISSETTTFGNVRLGIRVVNNGNEAGTNTLVGQVDIQGGDTYTQRQSITVNADSGNDFTMEFDIDISESLSGSRYTADAFLEE